MKSMQTQIEPTIANAGPVPLRAISSMATRLLLATLAQSHANSGGAVLQLESVGGVDAARRVAAGEEFDLVFLASDAIDKLIASGHLESASKVDIAHSGVAVAVPAGAPWPDIGSAAALRAAVLAAPSISYSTGPSGVALMKLFEQWGIAALIASRMVQAPPGVPVGSLVARGEVALGFQQRSELIHLQGIAVVGPLPPEIQITTTFSAALTARLAQRQAASDPRYAQARALLAYMVSAQTADAKREQGMEPA